MRIYIETLKKIDLKYLISISAAILFPFIYMWIRIFWISDNGSETIATVSFQVYIQMFVEILAAFLLIPLLTYNKQEYNQESLTILTSVLVVLFLAMIGGTFISTLLVEPVSNLNPDETLLQIRM